MLVVHPGLEEWFQSLCEGEHVLEMLDPSRALRRVKILGFSAVGFLAVTVAIQRQYNMPWIEVEGEPKFYPWASVLSIGGENG